MTGRRWAAAVAATMLSLPAAAQAGPVLGSSGFVTNRPCGPTETCVFNTKDFEQFYGGAGGGLNFNESLPGGASVQGSAAFGEGYLPVLKVGAFSGDETRTNVLLMTYRSFTYEGDAAIDLALTASLHYENSNDAGGDHGIADELPGEGWASVGLAILPLSAFSGIAPGATGEDVFLGFPSLACGFGPARAGASADTSGTSGENTVATGLSQDCSGAAITINPGESFVVAAFIQALVNRGGFVDATNTFTISYDTERTVFSGTTDEVGAAFLLANINGGVPEPATWALMIGGFAATGAALRRRRGLARA